MPTVSNFSNGQTLTSSALTETGFQQLLQTMLLGVLGIDPASDAGAYAKVRIGWVVQPAWLITDDICSIRASEGSDPYNLVRERKIAPGSESTVTVVDTYQRTWKAQFVFYGPNSFDHARLLKSALLQDFTHDALAAANVYVAPAMPATIRAPELKDGQWWPRADVSVTFNEGVTESLTVDSIASAEILLYTERGLAADLTVS